MTLNGSLAGLVAITAGCSAVDPWASAIIGAVSGILVVLSVEFFDKIAKIDDPAGAISVHGVNGLWGTLAVGLFARDGGLFTTGHCGRFLVQLVGALSTIAFVGVCAFILFIVIKKTAGLRVSPAEEIGGLDLPEHGLASGYADFMPQYTPEEIEEAKGIGLKIPESEAIPVVNNSAETATATRTSDLHKIVIVTRQNKFDALKNAMNQIGVTGMTVINVMGCGVQKGRGEYYRGAPVTMNLLPKIKVEIVVAKVPVETVIHAAKKALYTGHIGDGKIFVYPVDTVVKVRTGARNFDALQDED